MNKSLLTAAWVLSIIGIVFAAIGTLIMLMLYSTVNAVIDVMIQNGELYPGDAEMARQLLNSTYGTVLVVFLIVLALDIVLVVVYGKAKNDKISSGAVLGWSIAGLFVMLPAGICGLIAALSKDESNKGPQNELTTVETKLAELNRLLNAGIITSEEYELKRKRIIDRVDI